MEPIDPGITSPPGLAARLHAWCRQRVTVEAFGYRGALLVLFTISGFAGLIYESIWSHYLRLLLGHASYAQTLVLVIFMGGMAVGSALASRLSSRWRNLLLVYALVEAVIGVLGLIFHPVFERGTGFAYTVVFPALDSPFAIQGVKWSIAAALITSQSILLGMTFPLISGAFIRRFPRSPGASIAMLYFTNSLGAAVGVLASGFVLISWVGLPGTIMTAGLLSILLAAIVWLMSRSPEWRHARPLPAPGRDDVAMPNGSAVPLLVAALITGAASFMYEIAWIRMLSHVLGSSTHAFELILSAFIFGLACGSFWIRGRLDRWRDPLGSLGFIQIAMGMLALATLISYNQSFELMGFAVRNLSETAEGYRAFNVVSHAIAFGVMIPATFCAGMTLPLVTHVLLRGGHGEKSIGGVYAANTVGAIVGIVLAVQLAMPLLGVKGVVSIGAALDIGLGIYILLRWPSARSAGRAIPAAALGALAMIATVLFVQLDPKSSASAVYRYGTARVLPGTEIAFHRDGKTASVDLLRYEVGVNAIATNGKTDATINMIDGAEVTTDEITMVLAGTIPLAARPESTRAAVIGFGSGMTTHVLLGSASIESVDTIEIESAMVEASHWFRPRVERAYSDARSRIRIDDARSFFSTNRTTYDIIISEPSHPWVSGVSNLYSAEFYRLVKRYLTDTGVLVQWLHLREINPVLVASVVGALSSHFSRFAIYNTNDRDILILAANGGDLALDYRRIAGNPLLAAELERVGIRHEQDISARRIGGDELMDAYYESFSTSHNSDYFPLLDLNAFRAQFLNQTATELFSLAAGPLPVVEMLGAEGTSSGFTEVTPGSPLRRLRSMHTATILRDYLDTHAAADAEKLPGEVLRVMRSSEVLLASCGDRHDADTVIAHLKYVADRLTGFLRPEELAVIWQRMEERACTEDWSLGLRRWFSLVKAVSARDARGMSTIAVQLLESGEEARHAARSHYLVAAGMLGRVSLGDSRGAMNVWSRYGSPAMAAGEYGAILRLLVARGTS